MPSLSLFAHTNTKINIYKGFTLNIFVLFCNHTNKHMVKKMIDYTYYDEDDNKIYVDEREDDESRLDSQANHDSMVGACDWE